MILILEAEVLMIIIEILAVALLTIMKLEVE
jgi:hypothetical protein